ncbi:MAG: restriction endonuclease, partial [Smithella sp.]
MKLRNIEIMEKDSNKKGDLFGRLMSDFFHTLGYDEPRLNIHKSGREVDLTSQHRTEQKIAIAECKAHLELIGGSDINKFIGVIDAEKRKLKKGKTHKGYNIVGYFISLSGFKETAIEQENDCDNDRLILIKPDKIIDELIRGRILVSIEYAISCLSSLSTS